MKFIDVLADGEDVAQSNTQPISLQCFLQQEFNKWINTLWLRKIEAVLHRIGARKWIGNDATIRCQFITGTRPWKERRLDLILSYNNDLVLKPNLEELVCGFKSSSSARKPNARLSPREACSNPCQLQWWPKDRWDRTAQLHIYASRRCTLGKQCSFFMFLQQSQAGLKKQKFSELFQKYQKIKKHKWADSWP